MLKVYSNLAKKKMLVSMIKYLTRMHSSRMRTARSLTVRLSLLLCGGCLLLWGGASFLGRSPSSGAASFLGGLLLRGVPPSFGGLLLGECLLLLGVSFLGRYLLLGGCLLLGGSPSWGVSPPWREVSQHALRQTPPPVNRITHSCKNITLATTTCGR